MLGCSYGIMCSILVAMNIQTPSKWMSDVLILKLPSTPGA